MEKIQAYLVSGRISSTSKESFELFEKSRFGEKSSEKILYSLTEAFFLVEEKKMEIFKKDKKMKEKEIEKEFEKLDKKFMTKYLVFKDLRKKGYIFKTALKFGAEFRVYERGVQIGEEHATWILFPVSETDKFSWHDFSAKNRIANSTNKKLLIGIVDEEGDVSYYEVGWEKM